MNSFAVRTSARMTNARRTTIGLTLFAALPGCVSAQPGHVLSAGCNDVAVIGRIETLTATAV